MRLRFVLALQEHQVRFQHPQLKKGVGKMENAFREEPQEVMKN